MASLSTETLSRARAKTSEGSKSVIAATSMLAGVGQTLVDVLGTRVPCVARPITLAAESVDHVDTIATMQAWIGNTFVNLFLTLFPFESWLAQTLKVESGEV